MTHVQQQRERKCARWLAWLGVLAVAAPMHIGGDHAGWRLPFAPARLLAQERDKSQAELFREVDAAMQRARQAEVPLLAPSLLARAQALHEQAVQDSQKGEPLDRIRGRLHRAIRTLNRAIEVARASKVALADVLEARGQAAALQFIKALARETFSQAEEAFREAVLRAEAGDIRRARGLAKRASKGYREATLKALAEGPVQEAAKRLAQAGDALARARGRYSAAERELAALATTLRESKNQEFEIAALVSKVSAKIGGVLGAARAMGAAAGEGGVAWVPPDHPIRLPLPNLPIYTHPALATENDSASTDEDTDIYIDVLSNDGDGSFALTLPGEKSPLTTSWGAKYSRGPGKTLHYDPRASALLQSVPPGGFVLDSFTYGVVGGPGGLGAASVFVTVWGTGDLDAFVANMGDLPWQPNADLPNTIWSNGGSGNFTASAQSLVSDSSWDVALGDLNGDGRLDAFVANHGANKVWLSTGSGDFSDSGWFLGSASRAVALGDLDGDKDLDAFVANQGPNKVWLNDSGQLEDSGQSLGNSNNVDVALGDLDEDGDLDAFVVAPGTSSVWLNEGNASGNFVESQNLSTLGAFSVALEDLDGDGDLDAFLAHGPDGNIPNTVWRNNGQGQFQNSGQSLGSSSSWAVALGDLDGDGDVDAFVANGFQNSQPQPNTVWLNDDSGNFMHSQDLGNAHSRDVALGDLDGDGDLDAYVANGEIPNVGLANTVWSNESGNFVLKQQVGSSNSWAVALGDLDAQ